MKTIAAVVTFNKIKLLKECLEAILKQEVPVTKIVVVDNGSTDGSREYLLEVQNEIIKPIFTDSNLGGAGGFNLAIKKAMDYDPENIWVMDDDTIPEPVALKKFQEAIINLEGNYGFLSSNVLWTDRKPCLMNITKPEKIWNTMSEKGLVRLHSASFVSMIINAQVIKKIGYPISDFFIWGDDIEYSKRISRVENSYFVGESIVIHKMNENTEVNILLEDKARVPRYYYDIRNKFYIAKKDSKKEVLKYVLKTILLNFKVIFSKSNFKILKVKTIIRGFIAGMFFNPKIERCE